MNYERQVQSFVQNTFRSDMFDYAIKRIGALHRNARASRESSLLILSGQAGVGKTSIVHYYASLYPRVPGEEADHIPVLKTEMPANPSMRDIIDALLREIVDPTGRNSDSALLAGSRTQLTARLKKFVSRVGVELIIIDEAHHMFSRCSTTRARQAVADVLKELLIKLNVPLLLVGLPELLELVEPEEEDPDNTSKGGFWATIAREQLASRSLRPVDIPPIPMESSAWIDLLSEYEKALPVPSPNLTTKDMSRRMFIASRGLHRELSKLLAETIRSRRNNSVIRVDDLAEAFDMVSTDTSVVGNPFTMTPRERDKALDLVLDAA